MIRGLQPAASVFAAVLAAGTARADECARATEGPTVAQQPDAWRAAVAELVSATADARQPWGCSGGTVDVVVHGTGATLLVHTSDGTAISRDVDAIEDLVPLGEALLAKPEVPPKPETPLTQLQSAPVTKPDGAPVKPAEPVTDPRVVVSAVAAPRYAGRSNMLLGGLTADVAVPIMRWVPGGWIRFAGPLAALDEHATSFMEVSLGASFGRVFSAGPVDITPRVTGSAAIQLLPEEPEHHDEAHVDARLGADARVAFPRKSLFRAVFTTDFEIAPGEFDDDEHRGAMGAPSRRLPSYTLGLGAGFEIAPR